MAELPDFVSGAPVGRGRVPREVMADHQRERIMLAVTPVFAKRGYPQTTVEDLVAAGQTGVGTLYSLFGGGKESCFLACYERVVGEVREEILTATEATEDWAGKAYLGLRALLAHLVEAPLEARVALIEVQSAGPAATARYNEVADMATEWLRSARPLYPQAEGLPERFEQASVAGLAWFLQQEIRTGPPRPVEALLADTASMVLEPIVGEAEVRRLSAELAFV